MRPVRLGELLWKTLQSVCKNWVLQSVSIVCSFGKPFFMQNDAIINNLIKEGSASFVSFA